jgi:hypothetical protein
MARTPRWEITNEPHGIQLVRLSSWKYFSDYIRQEMLDYRTFVWRGHRCNDWSLQSTLDRQLTKVPPTKRATVTARHLENFKFATRGRRGSTPAALNDDNDWWALGQHFGLSTPLLDWTASPYVAAYFAFAGTGSPQTVRRSVFALAQNPIETACAAIRKLHAVTSRPPVIEFVRPLSDENSRLVNQGGLFSRAPLGVTIEEWIKSHIAPDHRIITLIKIDIPNRDRELALRTLNRMNINHLTLFPDLFGASKHCNMDISIDKY